jgi:hypothetical protein
MRGAVADVPKNIRLEFAPIIDNILDDGTSLTRLPYPFYVDENGFIESQSLWHGNPFKVIGFQKDLYIKAIDFWWREIFPIPERAVGMYLVTTDKAGAWSVHSTAIASALEFDFLD